MINREELQEAKWLSEKVGCPYSENEWGFRVDRFWKKYNKSYANTLEQAAQTLLANMDAMVWQPIETAPKDTRILVSGGVAQSVCSGSPDWFDCKGVFVAIQYHGYDHYVVNDYFYVKPTHWRPLPVPPTTETHSKP